jgi:hypothetical protein
MWGWSKSVTFSLILVWSLLSSLCVVCPEATASRGSSHDCCKPVSPDHCGRHNPQKQCPGHGTTFESHSKIELPGLAGTAHLAVDAETPAQVAPALVPVSEPSAPNLRHPPPQRFLLNSVLLI